MAAASQGEEVLHASSFSDELRSLPSRPAEAVSDVRNHVSAAIACGEIGPAARPEVNPERPGMPIVPCRVKRHPFVPANLAVGRHIAGDFNNIRLGSLDDFRVGHGPKRVPPLTSSSRIYLRGMAVAC